MEGLYVISFLLNLCCTILPNMTENIKGMFKQMNDFTREDALSCLMLEFDIKSPKLIKNNWIIGGRIPEANQARTVEIFQNLLRQQEERIRNIKVFTS